MSLWETRTPLGGTLLRILIAGEIRTLVRGVT